jgi:short-subunit dehydrogenase
MSTHVPRRVLVVGATSAIAQAVARRFAVNGDHLFLAGRSEPRLRAIADDLLLRGAGAAHAGLLDINHLDRHAQILEEAETALGGLDIVFIAHGTLPDQVRCQKSAALAVQEFTTNATSTIAFLTRVAELFERRRAGTIAVITSVAGQRGRQSNYVYGAAKAAVDTFLEGLRQRLYRANVRVTSIRPGFVDTPMTAAFAKGPLWASPEGVARRIHSAILQGRDVVYAPPFWAGIMTVIRLIPRPVFKTLRL